MSDYDPVQRVVDRAKAATDRAISEAAQARDLAEQAREATSSYEAVVTADAISLRETLIRQARSQTAGRLGNLVSRKSQTCIDFGIEESTRDSGRPWLTLYSPPIGIVETVSEGVAITKGWQFRLSADHPLNRNRVLFYRETARNFYRHARWGQSPIEILATTQTPAHPELTEHELLYTVSPSAEAGRVITSGFAANDVE